MEVELAGEQEAVLAVEILISKVKVWVKTLMSIIATSLVFIIDIYN
jgi:hypothetical protein